MKIKSFIGGFDKNISYLIWCESTRRAGIVDAAVDIYEIIEFIESKNLILEKLFITHSHFDHIKYIEDLRDQFPQLQLCGYYLPEEDFGVNHRGLTHHEIIPIGTEILTVLHTPGHYPDSICLWNKKDNSVFTGDTMFVGRTGRTIGAKSNISHLYNSIYETLLILPPQTIIYSGHHYGFKKSISLRENVRLSSFFQCTSEKEFMKVMEQFEKNRRI